MRPPLVSKIGCRATTFQTTRDSYELITSIRERRKFHRQLYICTVGRRNIVEYCLLDKVLMKQLRYMNFIVRHLLNFRNYVSFASLIS